MDLYEYPSAWWKSVAGPHAVIESIERGLASVNSVLLRVPADLPWRHEMRRAVRVSLQSTYEFGEIEIETIDAAEEGESFQEPGSFLLDRFGLKDDRLGFRGDPSRAQSYLLERRVIKNKIVWIKGLSPDELRPWLRFCECWGPSRTTDGLFVLEVPSSSAINPRSHLTTVDYLSKVNEYSASLFSGLLMDAEDLGGLSTKTKRYLSSLLTHLCGLDAEVAWHLIANGTDRLAEDPVGAVLDLVKQETLPFRGESPEHVLALVRSENTDELMRRVWAAQVESLFPLIETHRLNVVENLKERLSALISTDEGITQYGNRVEQPSEVELGTLVFLMAKRHVDGTRYLNVESYEMRSSIHLLHRLRNNIAHGNPCEWSDIKTLLER